MKLEITRRHEFDATLEINRGILADEIVVTTQGVAVRRVTYQDPQTGIIHHYLTTLPAAIARLVEIYARL